MRTVVFYLALFTSYGISAKGSCMLEDIGLEATSNIAEKLFYTGTCHYRNKDYEMAVKNWSELSALEKVDPEYEELQIDTLNNLGYMKFFGFGTSTDKDFAIENWKKAILLGHDEAEYHLYHAYADNKEPTYNLARARKHCRKALLIYRGMDDADEEILSSIEEYNERIN